jgi:hypothetical protein
MLEISAKWLRSDLSQIPDICAPARRRVNRVAMKTAITFAFLLGSGVAMGAAFIGCSSDPETPVTQADTGLPDTGLPDTKPAPDTAPPDTAPIRCDQPVGTDYECPEAPNKAGEKVCTDAMLNEVLDVCFGTGDATKCSAWQKKYPACNTCALSKWLFVAEDGRGFLDTGACMQKIDPMGTCGQASNCWFDCRETVCAECDDDQRNACWTRARRATEPKGSCYDKAYKAYNDCTKDAKFAPCLDAVQFLRGACRDGGDWSKAGEELPVADAGTDTGTSTDTGTAPTDTGSDTGTAATDSATASDSASDATAD